MNTGRKLPAASANDMGDQEGRRDAEERDPPIQREELSPTAGGTTNPAEAQRLQAWRTRRGPLAGRHGHRVGHHRHDDDDDDG